MSGLALALVLLSALCHSTWNYFLKRVSGGPAFLWMATFLSSVIYSPLALGAYLIYKPQIGWIGIGFIAATSLLHTIYFLLLAKGYRLGDLSLVYPLARGTGPLITILIAISVLHERPSVIALIGALTIATGVFLLTGDPRKMRQSGAGKAILFALLTGASIAAYTLTDKYGVATLMIPPLLFDWGANTFRAGALWPMARRDSASIRDIWTNNRREVIAVAVLSPLSYILAQPSLFAAPIMVK